MTIFKYALLRGVRNTSSAVINLVLPLILVFFRPLWEGDDQRGFYLIGMVIMYGSFLAARGIFYDKLDGTVIRILAGPVTSLRYFAQNLLASMVPLAVQIVLILLLGIVIHGWGISFAFALGLIYIVFSASSVTFSFAWSCLFKNKEVSYAVFSVLMSLVAMLGGFWIPLSIMPAVLRYIGAAFPAYWVSNGIYSLLSDGLTGTYWLSLFVVLAFGFLYLLYGGKRRII